MGGEGECGPQSGMRVEDRIPRGIPVTTDSEGSQELHTRDGHCEIAVRFCGLCNTLILFILLVNSNGNN